MKTIDFRYLVCSPDLNAHGTLHGGTLLRWIDEATGMHSRKLANRVCVTRMMTDIEFVSTGQRGDIMKITTTLTNVGVTSLTFSVKVEEDVSGRLVSNVGKVVFVALDHQCNPVPHGVIMQ
tara:strand:+ start:44 stop:406 length:363 start_codon:yes stop_codon:yes gene_type:complete